MNENNQFDQNVNNMNMDTNGALGVDGVNNQPVQPSVDNNFAQPSVGDVQNVAPVVGDALGNVAPVGGDAGGVMTDPALAVQPDMSATNIGIEQTSTDEPVIISSTVVEDTSKKKLTKKQLIIVGGVLLVVVIAVIVYLFVLKK